MVTTPYIGLPNTLITDVNFNTHTTAITELQTITSNAMDLSLVSTGGFGNGAWAVLSMSATPDFSSGSGLTASVNGVTVSLTGRYRVSVQTQWATNGTGYRGIAFSNTGSVGSFQALVPALAGFGTNQSMSDEISATAGQTISLFGYQSSGGLLVCNFRHISVRQVA